MTEQTPQAPVFPRFKPFPVPGRGLHPIAVTAHVRIGEAMVGPSEMFEPPFLCLSPRAVLSGRISILVHPLDMAAGGEHLKAVVMALDAKRQEQGHPPLFP